MKPLIRNLILALAVVLLAVAAAWWWQSPRTLAIPPALEHMGGEFRLQSNAGPVSLSDYRGKVVLIYFGYTHCPDVCPMALTTMGAAMQQLSDADGKRVAGVFISLDPRRDTPVVMAGYASFFDTRIVGLTASPAELAKVADAWRVGYSVPDEPADADYAVEHSTFIYLVNPKGKVAALFDEKTDPDEIAAAIRRWF